MHFLQIQRHQASPGELHVPAESVAAQEQVRQATWTTYPPPPFFLFCFFGLYTVISHKTFLHFSVATLKERFPNFSSLMESELTSLCQSVLEDFNLVLFYLPTAPPQRGHNTATRHSLSEEDEEQQQQQQQQQPATDGSCAVLPDALVFKMVVTCLMVVHSLKRGGKTNNFFFFYRSPALY